jgi:alpha-ketoglutarate-dependent 2,4-dichlorophenoxyacetate dioxygenase
LRAAYDDLNADLKKRLEDNEYICDEDSAELINMLLDHTYQDKYVLAVEWQNPGDLVLWDNTAVMHRAHGRSYEGKFRRDMRRTTVHDDSSYAWGLNEKTSMRVGLP